MCRMENGGKELMRVIFFKCGKGGKELNVQGELM